MHATEISGYVLGAEEQRSGLEAEWKTQLVRWCRFRVATQQAEQVYETKDDYLLNIHFYHLTTRDSWNAAEPGDQVLSVCSINARNALH